MRRPQPPTPGTMLGVLDDDDPAFDQAADDDAVDDAPDDDGLDDDGLDDDAFDDEAALDEPADDEAGKAWHLGDDADIGGDDDAPDAVSLQGNDWLKGDDGLDPFSVAFAGVEVDVERLAQAMLDQAALEPEAIVAPERRHRVSRHPATRRPGRR